MEKVLLKKWFFLIPAIVLLDQAIKQFFFRFFFEDYWFFPSLGFHPTFNSGIAFSLPVPAWLTVPLSSVVIFGLGIFYLSLRRAPARGDKAIPFVKDNPHGIASPRELGARNDILDLSFPLIIGGALSNLIDRFRFGAVLDYLSIFSFPTFNLADMVITVGFLLFLVSSFKKGI